MPVIPILPSDSAQMVEYKVDLLSQVAALEKDILAVQKWRNYYAGNHTLLLSDDQTAFLENIIDPDSDDWPIDNKVRKVIDKVRGRLNVVGWRDTTGSEFLLEDGAGLTDSDTSPLASAVRWWQADELDRWEGELYRAALRDEEGYLIVDHTGERPRCTVAYRWDGNEGIRMRYEDSAKTRPLYAIKYWRVLDPIESDVSGIQRATIYTSSAVYKYARPLTQRQITAYGSRIVGPRTPDGYYPVTDPGDTAWPLPWVDRAGAPLGLAVVPFISPRGSLVQAVIGLQNAINKTHLDLLSIADQQGFGLLVAEYPDGLPSNSTIGTDSDDPAGDGYGNRPGRVMEIGKGTIKKLEADDLSGLLALLRAQTVALAGNADIPLHEFTPIEGSIPSGAALQMLDAALGAQAAECAQWFGAGWRTAFALAQRLEATYGRGQSIADLQPVWAPTSYQDPTSDEELESKKDLRIKTLVDAGMPLQIALREVRGWDDEKINELMAAKEAEMAAAQTSLAGALMEQQRRFDQGGANA